MPRYKCFIFDLYGTLVDILTDETDPGLWRLLALRMGAEGARYEAEELDRAYLRLCSFEQAKSPEPLYEPELRNVFSALYEEKGVTPCDRLVSGTALFFRLASLRRFSLYPWTRPVLELLRAKGRGVCLLSNAQACFTRPELRALGLDSAFDFIAISSEAGLKKPHPGIMRGLLEQSGFHPGECIMIGNDRRSDTAVARAVSMDSLCIETETSPAFDPAFAAEYELRSHEAARLPELIKTLLEL